MGDIIKVKRDGPRGWHWIAAESFDPAVHERVLEETGPLVVEIAVEVDPAVTATVAPIAAPAPNLDQAGQPKRGKAGAKK